MTTRPFLDTNILVYAYTFRSDRTEDKRALIARKLLASSGLISVQMLTEFCDVMMRKYAGRWEEIVPMLKDIRLFCGPAIPLTQEIHTSAVRISAQYGFRIFDAILLAAAIHEGCNVLYTEDLQHSQTIEGLRIENPFLSLPAEEQ